MTAFGQIDRLKRVELRHTTMSPPNRASQYFRLRIMRTDYQSRTTDTQRIKLFHHQESPRKALDCGLVFLVFLVSLVVKGLELYRGGKSADKPGSVVGSHSSGPAVTGRL